jgi:Tfp pilus assembly protein PilF
VQAERFEEALTAFDGAITANPQCELAWFRKAEVLSTRGRLEEARTAYEQVAGPSTTSSALRTQAQQQLQLLHLQRPQEEGA